MNRYIFLSLCALVSLLPSSALAAEFFSSDQVNLTQPTSITSNTYIGGGQVTIETPIIGDLFIGGGTVRLNAPVQGDVFVAGGDIMIEEPIKGDLRVAGGTITVNNTVSGETMIGGGNVHITANAKLGDMWVATGQLTIAGSTKNITAGVGDVTLENTARIEGNMIYTSEHEANIVSGATISGDVTRHIPPMNNKREKDAAAIFGTGIVGLLSTFIILILFMYGLPNKAHALARSWRQNFASNLLWGIISLIITPLIVLLLAISLLGLPLAGILLALYMICLYLGNLVATLAIGMWLKSLWIKSDSSPSIDWLSALLGLIVVTILGIIPVVGTAILFVAFVTGFGALIKHDWALYGRLRQSKEF